MGILTGAAREFVDIHRIARLATASSDGEPHAIPFCYARIGDCIYFVIDGKPKRTNRDLKRLQNIRANPKVALVIDDYDDDWTQLAYLLLHGKAVIVDDVAEFAETLQLLRVRYSQYVEMPLTIESNPMVRIKVERMRLWRHGK